MTELPPGTHAIVDAAIEEGLLAAALGYAARAGRCSRAIRRTSSRCSPPKKDERGQADPRHRRRVGRVDRPRAGHRLVEALAARADRPRHRASDQGHRDGRAAGGAAAVRARLRPAQDPGDRRGVDARAAQARDRGAARLRAAAESLAALTPSDGVHLYLLQRRRRAADHQSRQPARARRRARPGRLRDRAAERDGDGRRYRWHRREPIGGIAKAPERCSRCCASAGKGRARIQPRGERPRARAPGTDVRPTMRCANMRSRRSTASCRRCARRPSGKRNAQLNESALKIAALVAAGALEATLGRSLLEAAARDNPGRDDDRQLQATIDSGWSAGMNNPRDLSEIAAAARRAIEARDGSFRASAPRSRAFLPPPARRRRQSWIPQPFRNPEGRARSSTEAARSPPRPKRRGSGASPRRGSRSASSDCEPERR
jgi:hypothetical protein